MTAVDEQAGDMPDLVPEQALFWVACYLTSQSYGGLDEGGWWFIRAHQKAAGAAKKAALQRNGTIVRRLAGLAAAMEPRLA